MKKGRRVTDSKRAQREPMSKVDTAWLRMESPTNLMMITGIMVFSESLSLVTLRDIVEQRFLSYPRFRHKAVDDGASAEWVPVEKLKLDWHVRKAKLPAKAGKPELEKFVSELASTALDHAKPLWQFHLVENYQGGCVVVIRIHHCYADGLALVQVMMSLTDAAPSPKKRAELAKVWAPRDQGGVMARLMKPVKGGVGAMLDLGAKWLRDPKMLAVLARESAEITRELAIALSLSDDPPTSLKNAPLGSVKRCAWAAPLPLADVKAIGKVLGCTVNDVLLACATGALRNYLHSIGEDVDGLTIRATVPVNLRPLEHAKKLGNHFGLVFLDLPIGEPNPLCRLELVASSMLKLKGSRQAALTFGLLAAVGMAPPAVQRMALEMFSRKATTVATNVPGPQMPLYLGGREVRELMFWVPQNGSVGMGLSLLSYNGNVHFGLIADSNRVTDPDGVAQRFAREVEKLTLITMMEDWARPIHAVDAESTLQRFA